VNNFLFKWFIQAAIRLYLKLKFLKTEHNNNYYDDGEDAYTM